MALGTLRSGGEDRGRGSAGGAGFLPLRASESGGTGRGFTQQLLGKSGGIRNPPIFPVDNP